MNSPQNSEDLSEVFRTAVSSGDIEKVKSLVSIDQSLIHSVDKEGLSPLQLACFAGSLVVVEYLLKSGVNVNSTSHKQNYTALMFAALSGNSEVVELLLQNGARTNDTNSIGRTACQLAAFVGNHSVVTLINNFIDKEEVHVLASKQALPVSLQPHLYRLISQLNFTPVKIFLILNNNIDTQRKEDPKNVCLLTYWDSVVTILEKLCNNYFTAHQTHEGLSIKFHLLSCCITQAGKFYEKVMEDSNEQVIVSPLKNLIKKFLLGVDPHGLPCGQEKFLRQTITSFPHRESNLWMHIIRQLSPIPVGSSPTALSILTKAINGGNNFNFNDLESCTTCGDGAESGYKEPLKLCQQCKTVAYCSINCQRLHWFTHKKYCPILNEYRQKAENTQKKLKSEQPNTK